MKQWMWVGLALLGSTSAQAAETRIIGGDNATQGAWPWIVSLEYAASTGTPYDAHFCGGSLIASQWVLTAAHCVEDATPADLLVRVGGYDLSSTGTAGTAASVDRILMHPEYNGESYDQDLALLHLSSAVAIDPLASIGYSAMASLAAGSSLTVMGWGATRETIPYNYPEVLQQVAIPLLSDASCSAAYSGDITENMLCAGEMSGGKDSCYGDSGGPLILGDSSSTAVQVGIVSWGNGCGLANFPGVYTRLANYSAWLSQHQSHLSMDTYTDLGYVPVGYTTTGVIPVQNNGESPASLTSLLLDTGSGFSLGTHSCADVATGGECSVAVSFANQTAGDYSELLSATDSSSGTVMENKLSATVLPVVTFSNAITSSSLVWYSGGDSVWQDGATVNNRLPLVAGKGGNNSVSVLQTTVTGPATVSFEWSVASGNSNSVLTHSLDGVEQATTSSSSWQSASVSVGTGTHLLEWRLTKSASAPLSAEARLATLTVTATGTDDSGDDDTDDSTGGDSSTDSGSSGGGSIGWLWSLVLLGLYWTRRR